jgi:shikimate 5-dehydrogenase
MRPETDLLREARRRGCAVHPGRLMLECQLGLRLAFLGLHVGAAGSDVGAS